MESNLQAPLRSRAAARRRLRLSVKVTAAAVTVFALFASGALLLLDLRHGFLTSRPHRLISALPLLGIALGGLTLQLVFRPDARALVKRGLLSLAFVCWGANQLSPNASWAPVANDLAIGLFVLDLGLIIRDEHREQAADARAGRSLSPSPADHHATHRSETCPRCGPCSCFVEHVS